MNTPTTGQGKVLVAINCTSVVLAGALTSSAFADWRIILGIVLILTITASNCWAFFLMWKYERHAIDFLTTKPE